MRQVAQGSRIALEVQYRDSADALVDPTDPLVNILDPAALVVAANVVPVRRELGIYDYPDGGYLVASDAVLGEWTARWSGAIGGVPITPIDERFEVLVYGSLPLGADWISLLEARAWPEGDQPTEAILLESISAASQLLQILSGRRYTTANPPTVAAKRAAKELSVQLALAATPATAGKSRLPTRVTTVARQGLTFVVLDPQQFLNEGRTGLYYVDLFLKTVNPGRNQGRGRVFSPDFEATAYEVR